jgi:type IV secretory pathway VirB2 component (pilin)
MAVIAVVASGAAAVFGWLIFDKVSQGVVCTNIESIVKTIRP